jgi:hypothetical protein
MTDQEPAKLKAAAWGMGFRGFSFQWFAKLLFDFPVILTQVDGLRQPLAVQIPCRRADGG